MPARPATRLFIDAALGAGAAVTLGAAEAHRLRAVLRLKPGDAVVLLNGRDGEWLGRIETLGRAAASLTVAERLRAPAPEGDLWLAFALIKRPRLEFLIEKAVELGVSRFLPVITRHTVVERVNLDRLAAQLREAAEQSERLTLPALEAPQPLDRFAAQWPAARRLVLCDESGTAPGIAEVVAPLAGAALGVLIGPEGGFAETELDALRKLPFVCPVGLGPRVLRCDTAALAAVAVIQALAGDWSMARQRRPRANAAATP